jgi:hypothetical protein
MNDQGKKTATVFHLLDSWVSYLRMLPFSKFSLTLQFKATDLSNALITLGHTASLGIMLEAR